VSTGRGGTDARAGAGTGTGDRPPFTALPDLASRALGGTVVYANDELFAARENLIRSEPPVFSAGVFGPKGKVYDGWETRRRRDEGHDYAVVRLGAAGIVHGVVVDTAFFRGNYPPEVSVEATAAEGYPAPAELAAAHWTPLVPRSPVAGDAQNLLSVEDRRRYTHVRLSIYPDGGVARLRIHGEVVPDPRFLSGTIDLAAAEHGGTVLDCSDMFYSSPSNLTLPGRARLMGEGWETARRRDAGNDWVALRLAVEGCPRHVEIDTSYFVGNAPGWARLTATAGSETWEVLPRTRLQPDTRHRFVVADPCPATQLRLDIYPDGGLARLRVHGEPTPSGRAGAAVRWLDALPVEHARAVLRGVPRLPPSSVDEAVDARPYGDVDRMPAALRAALLG
jgi:allantoicase